MSKVSFIVPVYNCEKYLRKCLDSILNQTVEDIEIICVDDCSTDQSREILREYEGLDNRIVAILQDRNSGPGVSRNIGLMRVNGEYIRMVDADDFIPHKSTEWMLDIAIKNNCDFVRGGMFKYYNNGKVKRGGRFPEETLINLSMKHDRILWYFDQHFTYLYKTEIVNNRVKAKYDENMRNGQDVAFLLQLVPFMENVTLIDKPVYYYRQTPDSTVRGRRKKEYYINIFSLYEKQYKYLAVAGFYEQVEHYIYWLIKNILPIKIFTGIVNNLTEEECKEVFSYFSAIIKRYHVDDLCFTSKYQWHDLQNIPIISKKIILFLSVGDYKAATEILYDWNDNLNLSKKYKDIKIRYNKYKMHIMRLENRIRSIEESNSWKITKPIRSMKEIIYRSKN